MSTPITEAHLRLANQIVASPPSPLVIATLIADSGALVSEINRLLVRLDAQGVSANEIVACIKPLIADSEARAVADLKRQLNELEDRHLRLIHDKSVSYSSEVPASERAMMQHTVQSLHNERDQLRAALAKGQQNCDDAYDDLRAERDAAQAQRDENEESARLFEAAFQEQYARAERAEAELAAERARLERELHESRNAERLARVQLGNERARLYDLLSINATGAARLAHAAVQLAHEREKVRTLRLACERIVEQWDADHDTNPIGAGNVMYSRASAALAATEDAQ